MVVWRAISRRGISAIARDPLVLFSLYFALIHFITPLAKYWEGIFRYQSQYEVIQYLYTILFSIVFYVFACFWSEYFRRRYGNVALGVSARSGAGAMVVGYILCALGVLFSFKDLSTIQSAVGGVESFLSDRHSFAAERGTSRVFSNLLLVGTAVLLAGRLNVSSSKLFVPIYIGVFGFSVFYFNVLSSRNSVLILFILNVSVYLFYRLVPPKITKRTLLVSTLVASSVVGLGVGAYKITIDRYSVADSAYMEERRDSAFFYMLDGAFGNDEARLWFLEHGQEYYFGETYLAAMVNFIPRSMWPEKPLGAGPRLINQIRPGSYVVGGEGNNSLTTGLVVEAQMNFGNAGVFVAIVLWAYFANLFIRKASQSPVVLHQVGFLVLAVSLSTIFIYSEFLGYIVRLGLFLIPVFAFSLVPIRALHLAR